MKEPPRITDLDELVWYVRGRVLRVLGAMTLRGFDPIVYETYRTQERQEWLYGVGRTHSLSRKPVTYTRSSYHTKRKAVDIISKSTLWSDDKFFKALKEEAAKEGLKTLDFEGCHIEWS